MSCSLLVYNEGSKISVSTSGDDILIDSLSETSLTWMIYFSLASPYAGHSAKKCWRFSGALWQSLHFYFHQLFTNFTNQIKFCSVLTWSDLSFSRDFVGMVTRIASKMEGRKKDKHQQQYQQHEDKDKCDNRLKCWLGKHGELVDFSDVAPSPCKDFYHVFVTPQEVSLIIAS